jgi:O-antigen chain-terminating methyltransferase
MEVLKRRGTEPADRAETAAATSDRTTEAARTGASDDYKYVAFEDVFRGSDESVAAKLEEYVAIFAGATDVVDLGCGRGEFLLALRSAGVRARGVDTNDAMVAVAREQALDVTNGDALSYVAALPDESIGGAIATQVIEHLEPAYLFRLLEALSRTLRHGAPLVLETINPACWYAFFSSYIRDITHVRPVHPETLQYLVRASGFERVEIRYRVPVPDHAKLQMTHTPAEFRMTDDPSSVMLYRVVDAHNRNAERLNDLMFSHMDYAVVGYRI